MLCNKSKIIHTKRGTRFRSYFKLHAFASTFC